MAEDKPTLHYEAKRPKRRPRGLRSVLAVLWSLLLLNLYGVAIMMPIFGVLGAVNFYRPVEGLQMFGRPVVTLRDKIKWEVSTVAISVVTVPLAVWHARTVLSRGRR